MMRLLIKIFILTCQFTLRGGMKRRIKTEVQKLYLYLPGKADIIYIVVGGCAKKRYETDYELRRDLASEPVRTCIASELTVSFINISQ